MSDAIGDAFARMQAAAAKRGATPYRPPLKPTAEQKAKQQPKLKGRPTGADGRAIKYSNAPVGLGAILNSEIQRRGWQTGIAGGWVHAHWDELVGEKIAQHTKVEMIKDKKLFITCDSTAWATNLRMMQRQILQAISQKVGPDIIIELRIFGPKAPSWRKGPLHVKGRGPRDTYG